MELEGHGRPMTPEQLTEWLKLADIRCPLCNYSIYVYEDYDACCDNSVEGCEWYFKYPHREEVQGL